MSKNEKDIPLPGMVPETLGYPAPIIAKVTGVSYRRLDHWTRKGLITASVQGAEGSGSKRLYSFQDVLRINVITNLINMGISLAKIKTALSVVDRVGIEKFNILGTPDGKVIAIDEDYNLIDLLKNGQGMFFLGHEAIMQNANAQLATLLEVGSTTDGKTIPMEKIEYDDYNDFRRNFG